MNIVVLMSTYNGEKYLQEQLDSLYRQTLPLTIFVRDDGSTDATKAILEKNKQEGKPLLWYSGENMRTNRSFWNLIQNAPNGDYYAFCDQDDVWFDDKVARAIDKLHEVDNQAQPLLYCGSVEEVNENLEPVGYKPISAVAKTDFAHALLYSLAPGCTFVFNHLARTELTKYNMEENFVTMHDWLTHKIVAMKGTVLIDDKPCMYYRQHSGNVIGAKKRGLPGMFRRIKNLMTDSASIRSRTAKSLLDVYGMDLDTEKQDLLDMVASYKEDKQTRKRFLKCKAFSTSRMNDCALKFLIRLKRI